MKTKNKSFFPKYTAVICGVLTAAICGVMNLFLIPATEANTGGIRCFDMNIGKLTINEIFVNRLIYLK